MGRICGSFLLGRLDPPNGTYPQNKVPFWRRLASRIVAYAEVVKRSLKVGLSFQAHVEYNVLVGFLQSIGILGR